MFFSLICNAVLFYDIIMEGVRQLDHYIILFLGFENRYDVVVGCNVVFFYYLLTD